MAWPRPGHAGCSAKLRATLWRDLRVDGEEFRMKRFDPRYRCREPWVAKRSIGGERSDQSSGCGRPPGERHFPLLQLHLGQISIIRKNPGRCRQNRQRPPGLVTFPLDKIGAAGQPIGFLAQAVGLACGSASGRDLPLESGEREFLAYKW